MTNIVVKEDSSEHGVELTQEEVDFLNKKGRELVRSQRSEDDENDENTSTNLLVKKETDSSTWTIETKKVVGAIGFGDKTLIIEPKIPAETFLFIWRNSGQTPLTPKNIEKASLADAENFVDLVAAWYVMEIKQLLKVGLHRDYETQEQEVETLLGAVIPLPTAMNFYRGKLQFHCVFDEFTFDNPLNRVLVEALDKIMRLPGINPQIRTETRRLISSFPEVSPYKENDLLVEITRQQQRYNTPFFLAKQVIEGTGRNLNEGTEPVATFLLNSPSAIEDGLRNLLKINLASEIEPWKGRETLHGGFEIDPDLRFGRPEEAVGDVKYRLYGADNGWKRSEVHQLTTYAAALETPKGLLIGFTKNTDFSIEDLGIGSHTLRMFLWDVSEETDPENESKKLSHKIESFISPLAISESISA